jgi:hypothetical protein
VSANGTGALRQRHLGDLVGRLASDAGTLVRQEIELAKAELQERADEIRTDLAATAEIARDESRELSAKAEAVKDGATLFGVAGVAGLLALGSLTAAAVLLLHRWFAADVSAAIVAAVWALLAATFALRGRDRLRSRPGSWVPHRTLASLKNVGSNTELAPTQTIETVKEDVQWVKTRGRSDAR